jgi:hypothetical protein
MYPEQSAIYVLFKLFNIKGLGDISDFGPGKEILAILPHNITSDKDHSLG